MQSSYSYCPPVVHGVPIDLRIVPKAYYLDFSLLLRRLLPHQPRKFVYNPLSLIAGKVLRVPTLLLSDLISIFDFSLIPLHLVVMASFTAPQTAAGRRVMKYLMKFEKRSSNRKQRSKLILRFPSFFWNDEIVDLHPHSWPYGQTHRIQGSHYQTSAWPARYSSASCTGAGEGGSGERWQGKRGTCVRESSPGVG